MRHLWAVLALSLPVAVPFSAPQLPTGATGNHLRAYFSLPRPGAFSRARCGLDTLLCSGSHRRGEAPELRRADATFERWARAVGIEHANVLSYFEVFARLCDVEVQGSPSIILVLFIR